MEEQTGLGVVNTDYDIIKWTNPCKQLKEDNLESLYEKSNSEDDSAKSFNIEEPDDENILEVLKTIIPSRQWVENGKIWVQFVSPEPASRSYLLDLTEKLNRTLKSLNAHKNGICEIRRSIYTELFIEMIRQVTIKCLNRGLLLLRVRDDIKMTIEIYSSLCEGAIRLGEQKACGVEDAFPAVQEEMELLKEVKKEKELQLLLIMRKYDEKERSFKEWRDREIAKQKRRVDFLKATNEALQMQWDLITAWKPQNVEMGNYLFDEI